MDQRIRFWSVIDPGSLCPHHSSIGQSSFSYADSILTSWYNDKVHSLEDVKRLDATHQQKKKERAALKANAAASPKKNNFNNFESRENDYKSLEAML